MDKLAKQLREDADRIEVTVSEEFLAPGREYTLEVFAIDASGNQTLTETAFVTAE